MQKVFTSMVVAGGAMKSMCAIGCVRYLEEVDKLSHIRNFLGSSAGSVVCLFLALGYSSIEIQKFVFENTNNPDVALVDINEAFHLIDSLGLNKGKSIDVFVSKMLNEKIGLEDLTFLDLAKHTGKNLIVCVTNLTKNCSEYWSVDTVPNMSVVKAIRASCSIPFVFTPVMYNNCIYVDGGVLDNFPVCYFDDSSFGDVIGLNILTNIHNEHTNKSNKHVSFIDYTIMVSNTIINKLTSVNTKFNDKIHIVTVIINEHMWFSFERMMIDFPSEVLEKYIHEGYSRTKESLTTTP